MLRHFTLEYWIDEGWYVGRLKEVPGVFSQGESLAELEENIRDAYHLMMEEEIPRRTMAQAKEIGALSNFLVKSLDFYSSHYANYCV